MVKHPPWNERLDLLEVSFLLTLPETNSSHLKIGFPKRKVVFQPSIFKGYVSSQKGSTLVNQRQTTNWENIFYFL